MPFYAIYDKLKLEDAGVTLFTLWLDLLDLFILNTLNLNNFDQKILYLTIILADNHINLIWFNNDWKAKHFLK